jgi:hypothetical protein
VSAWTPILCVEQRWLEVDYESDGPGPEKARDMDVEIDCE